MSQTGGQISHKGDQKGEKASQMESLRLEITGHMTSIHPTVFKGEHLNIPPVPDGPNYKCSLCSKVGDYGKIVAHLQSHQLTALKHGDYTMYRCNRQCIKSTHFHCCFCGESRTPQAIVKHLKSCAGPSSSTMPSASSAAPVASAASTVPSVRGAASPAEFTELSTPHTGGQISQKGEKASQMESLRLEITGHMTSVGEQIVCVLEKHSSGDVCLVRVFVLERLREAAQFMYSLFQREMETLHTEDFLVLTEKVPDEQQERSSSLVLEKTHADVRTPQPTRDGQLLSSHYSETGVKSEGDDENGQMAPLSSASSEHTEPQGDVEGGSECNAEDSNATHPGKKSFSCKECGKMFNLRVHLQRHAIIHTGEKAFICAVCGRGFNRTHHLERHKLTHTRERPFTCTRCGKGFIRKDRLKSHVCSNSSTLKSDRKTRKGLNKLSAHKTHIRTGEIGETEPVASTTTEHMQTEVDVEDCGTSQPTSDNQLLSSHCSDFDTRWKSKEDENRELEPLTSPSSEHMETLTDIEDCGRDPLLPSDCSESDAEDGDDWEETKEGQSASNSVAPVSRTGKKTFSCKDCGKMFNVKGGLQRHAIIHTGEKPFLCTVCGKGFNRTNHLKRHGMTHAMEKPFTCAMCGKGFIRKDNLKRHVCGNSSTLKSDKKTHTDAHRETREGRSASDSLKTTRRTGKKTFSCKECGKMFHLNVYLQRHAVIHTGEKPFLCTVCGEGFNRSHHLKRHEMTHAMEKPFTCTTCGKGFSRKDHLKRHVCANSSTVKSDNCCTVCGKCFSQKGTLNAHMRIHTGERPFKCMVCNKGFRKSSDLCTHRRTHTGEKPFTCTVCGKGFSRLYDSRLHMRTHTRERPFPCTICGKGFSRRKFIKRHMMTHTGEKPFTCTVCGKCCSQKGDLNRHMRTHKVGGM